MKQWHKLLKYVGLGILGLFGFLLVWGLIEPYTIDLEAEVAEIPGLSAAWEGQQVALISDLQVGMWLGNTATIRRIVDRLIEQPPAAVLLAGDFIYHPKRNPDPELRQVVDLLRPLTTAGIPTYGVLGNHDYGIGEQQALRNEPLAQQVRTALEDIGVTMLRNQAVALTRPPTLASGRSQPAVPLYLVGIGAHLPGDDRAEVALAQVPNPAPRFVMMHNPASFAQFPAGTAPIAVAGHTHGGQIRLPLTPEWSWLTFTQSEPVHVDGWIDGYGQPGNHLYVSRGIGMSKIPIRLNCPPEVTRFTLRSLPLT